MPRTTMAWTPLHEAAYYGSEGTAKVLTEKGDELLLHCRVSSNAVINPLIV